MATRIGDLSDMRAAQIDLHLQTRCILVFRDQAKTKSGIELMRADRERTSKAWSDYYPSSVSNGEEHARGRGTGSDDDTVTDSS
ncbi:hypothetical protein [Burkholderia anthina]|uniref:hypothetical protein n=1 Tax=Burkholderia anthina TaxID=179879 RepID=UPI001AA01DB3|nr:hypothetical protein [Burkholderia anthina]QTD95323.1 hypothetical protein J4G50_38370 [Burkholderia anthina]